MKTPRATQPAPPQDEFYPQVSPKELQVIRLILEARRRPERAAWVLPRLLKVGGRRLKVREVDRLSGSGPVTFSGMCNGARVSLQDAARIAVTLGVSLDCLYAALVVITAWTDRERERKALRKVQRREARSKWRNPLPPA